MYIHVYDKPQSVPKVVSPTRVCLDRCLGAARVTCSQRGQGCAGDLGKLFHNHTCQLLAGGWWGIQKMLNKDGIEILFPYEPPVRPLNGTLKQLALTVPVARCNSRVKPCIMTAGHSGGS